MFNQLSQGPPLFGAVMEDWVSDAVALSTSLDNGKGRGLVVTRDVSCLELLMVACPFVTGRAEEIIGKARRLLVARDPRGDQFLALSDGSTAMPDVDISVFKRERAPGAAPTPVDGKRVKGIIETNAQGVDSFYNSAIDVPPVEVGTRTHPDASELICLWLLPSLLNHSCEPSIAYSVDAWSSV